MISEMEENIGKTSYDILEWFPIGVCQNIFAYLEGKDVIQASAVNKEWNKLCAESQQAKKLKLVLSDSYDRALTNEDVKLLRHSTRKYENIFIECCSLKISRFISLLLAHRGCWKSVKLNSCWTDSKTWSKIFRILEPTVEELVFFGNCFENPEDGDYDWAFPCLKVLESDHYTSKLCKMFVHCTTLVKLHWTSRDLINYPLIIPTFLLNNHNLKDLGISVHGSLLEHSIDFKFKLDKLLIYRSSDDDALYALLETQAQTLQSLTILAAFDRTSLELILRMPKLSSLTTVHDRVTTALWNSFAQPLPVNTTITSLEHKDDGQDLRCQETFKTLIRSLKSLKHFMCNEIGQEQFNFLAREVPALESFEAENLPIFRFPRGNIFPKLKKFEVGRFEGGLQEPTGYSNFAVLARKAMRES